MYITNENKIMKQAGIILAVWLVGMALFLAAIMNDVFGFDLFNLGKPDKPNTGIISNPVIANEFDVLYEKYPDITQTDVNSVYASASAQCFSETKKSVQENNPESADSPIGQLVGISLCNGIISGAIENYLDQLGIRYISDPDGGVPTLY